MRVLYNTCVADPWVKVAQRLRDDYGYEPVYWIGFNYDDSENINLILMHGEEFFQKRL